MDEQVWMQPQQWIRDSDQPCISLGNPGEFDDMHIFAPCVAFEDGQFYMWYCGSRGSVAHRVFAVGLATSSDGVVFRKHRASPVLAFADGTRSVLTPTLLRHPDGAVCREDGELRMWFSSCDFPSGSNVHTLHETTSLDGILWTTPSEAQWENVYAPTIIREGDTYRMWYTDVEDAPWCIRHASGPDGRRWEVTAAPVLEIDQEWEHERLFYPTVLRIDAMYLMWYGSYSLHKEGVMETSLGLAVSSDGFCWRKHGGNPIFGPDERRAWESHYTTSQSVMPLPDGAWRIWYASRTRPPFTHKYFAIGTATWRGPKTIDS